MTSLVCEGGSGKRGQTAAILHFMFKGLRASMIVLVGTVAMAASAAQAKTAWPPRSTPLHSTQGWFRAIDAHNRQRLLFYVARSAIGMMGWASPSRAWPGFTALDCKSIKVGATDAHIRCTFHESGSIAVVGTRDTFWDVYLGHTHAGWLIDDYGTG